MLTTHAPNVGHDASPSPSRDEASDPRFESQPTEVLFPEARRRERHRRLGALAALVAMAGLVGVLIASFGGAARPPRVATPPSGGGSPAAVAGHLTLRGDGVGGVRFGEAESVVIVALDKMLGTPRSESLKRHQDCTVDSYVQWSRMAAYFDHGKFVGYATASLQQGSGGKQMIPDVTTAAGLRIGDTLAQAQKLYGRSLETSDAQGGSWFAGTTTGRLGGYLTTEIGHTQSPAPRIADVTAGTVGCPAASP